MADRPYSPPDYVIHLPTATGHGGPAAVVGRNPATKKKQLDASIAQFRTQLRRLPRQTIYGRAPLEMALSAMGEIEERLQDAEDNRRRLLTIKQAAEDELAALESVQQVDEARKALARLKQQTGRQPMSGETEAEIRRLEQFIAIHSKRAELTITAAFEERREQG